jgi:putative glycosyltransferase (TIGR04372 family)
MDVLMSLHMACELGAGVLFIRPREPLNGALFELRSQDVVSLTDSVLAAPLRAYWFFVRVGFSLRKASRMVRTRIEKAIARVVKPVFSGFVKFLKRSSKSRRGPRILLVVIDKVLYKLTALDLAKKSKPFVVPKSTFHGLDFRARYARNPLPVGLSTDLQDAAERHAKELGITPKTKLVVLHVRESGYKQSTADLYEKQKDTNRNARIETYFKAVDYLAGEGYTVVKVGDRSMAPVSYPGILDLAISELNKDYMELWCFLKSDFFIGCDSGPNSTSLLTNVPSLLVNSINPVGAYPIRRKDLYILKRAIDPDTGRVLSLSEMLTEEFLFSKRNSEAVKYVDHTAEEILSAVTEMVRTVRSDPAETEPQREYKRLIQNVMDLPRVKAKYMIKAGIENPYIGDGRIAAFYAERYLHADIPERTGLMRNWLQTL